MLKINNITVCYENLTAVNKTDLEIGTGEIHGLVGPNGAGKSSLINVCTGLISEYEGDIFYGDKNIRENRQWVKENIGFAPEDTNLMPYLTGMEFLKLIHTVKCHTDSKDEEKNFINMLGLDSKINNLIVELSHGMRQKLLLASAFIGNPKYIIIDEALNGLDPIALDNVRKYFQELTEKKVTILISSHVLPLIREWCKMIHIMHQGKIIKKFSQAELEELEKQKGEDFPSIFLQSVKD